MLMGVWTRIIGSFCEFDLVMEHGADTLVLGSRRRTAVGKLMMGSTVQRVLLDSPVPVLVVKAP